MKERNMEVKRIFLSLHLSHSYVQHSVLVPKIYEIKVWTNCHDAVHARLPILWRTGSESTQEVCALPNSIPNMQQKKEISRKLTSWEECKKK